MWTCISILSKVELTYSLKQLLKEIDQKFKVIMTNILKNIKDDNSNNKQVKKS